MDQEKIGKFISAERKSKNMTQAQLAEQLNITDRAVSKWETGRSLPDSAIMLDLCNELNISVNELLNGERIEPQNYDNKAEEVIIKLQKEKESSDKRLLFTEMVLGSTATVSYLIIIFLSIFAVENPVLKVVIILIGLIVMATAIATCILIEQKAGYYQCGKCSHKYIPTYKQVLLAAHTGRTRYMRCPKCHKKSWNKKVI